MQQKICPISFLFFPPINHRNFTPSRGNIYRNSRLPSFMSLMDSTLPTKSDPFISYFFPWLQTNSSILVLGNELVEPKQNLVRHKSLIACFSFCIYWLWHWLSTYNLISVIQPCSQQPCKNSGTCTNYVTYYICNCTATWTGPECNESKEINPHDYNALL